MIIVSAEAPSNIALIKYMGKGGGNRPLNSSLSYSLDHLVTRVEIRPSTVDCWNPYVAEGFLAPDLSEKGRERFLAFFGKLKEYFKIPGQFEVRSANNFPADCGLASSASSFAALTKATYELALVSSENPGLIEALSVEDLSKLSREGSGSSCRSLFSPWAIWREEGAQSLALPYNHLHHQVVVLSGEKKEVSSSDAHKMVASSPLFEGRTERAERRLADLLNALNAQDWRTSFEIVTADFMDMHRLFETSKEPFKYMNGGSYAVLDIVGELWKNENDGPLVTLDAGPNVHLLYRDDQADMARELSERFEKVGSVISSPSLGMKA